MKSDDVPDPVSTLLKQHRGDLRFAMPAGLKEQVLESLPTRRPEPRTPLVWFSLGGGAVAACLSFILVFQLGRMSVSGPSSQTVVDEIVSAHVRSLMVAHIADVDSTDQHTVKPWFEGKIDFAPMVRDFKNEGFPLTGGRLDYVNSRPTAALIYKSNQHFINLLQQPAPPSEQQRLQLQSIRGYQVFAWTKDGMHYWAVSDLNAGELQRFALLWQP